MKALTLLCLILCTSCVNDSSHKIIVKKQELQVNANVSGFYHGSNSNCTFDFFLINMSLRNLSDTTFNYWVFTCGIVDNLLLSDSTYSIVYNNCDANYPVLLELKPRQTFVVPIILGHSDAVKSSYWPGFKIGFIAVYDDQHYSGRELLEKIEDVKKSKVQIYWSNEINLFTDMKKPYEIY